MKDLILIALMALYVAATVACFLLGSVWIGLALLVGGLICAAILPVI